MHGEKADFEKKIESFQSDLDQLQFERDIAAKEKEKYNLNPQKESESV